MTKKKLIRLKDVKELTGLSKSYIYQLQNQDSFPRSIQIIPNGSARAWLLSEVEDFIESRIQARDMEVS